MSTAIHHHFYCKSCTRDVSFNLTAELRVLSLHIHELSLMSLVRARVEVRCKQWKIMTHCPNTESRQSEWRHIPSPLPLQVDTLRSTLHLWCTGRYHRADPDLAPSRLPALKSPGTRGTAVQETGWRLLQITGKHPFSNNLNSSWVTSLPPTLENVSNRAAAQTVLIAPLQVHPPQPRRGP